MSRRAEHLAEMRLALAEGISLTEAKRRLARLRWQATVNAGDKARSAPEAALTPVYERPQPWWNRD